MQGATPHPLTVLLADDSVCMCTSCLLCQMHTTHISQNGYLACDNVAAAEGGVVDIQGVCKSTVAKGEDDFPDGILRITDCHDSVIYALAPLQYASITCCSDCTVVVGAVGKMLRVERCERLQLIAGCVRICISSCHESVFYLGVNRPPLLLGDNRFVQVWSALCKFTISTSALHAKSPC